MSYAKLFIVGTDVGAVWKSHGSIHLAAGGACLLSAFGRVRQVTILILLLSVLQLSCLPALSAPPCSLCSSVSLACWIKSEQSCERFFFPLSQLDSHDRSVNQSQAHLLSCMLEIPLSQRVWSHTGGSHWKSYALFTHMRSDI